MTPLVSIIVPVFKVGSYLDNCIRTLAGQTLKNIEIILVDDGSPDSCPAICDEWARKDGRIRVIHKENGGLGYARNSGLDVARGQYVAFVDSDDFVQESMYERLYSASEDGACDAVFCGYREICEDGAIRYVNDFEEEKLFLKEDMNGLAISFLSEKPSPSGKSLIMSVWHAIYRRDIIVSQGLRFHSEREIMSEDIPFQIGFIRHSDSVRFIPDYLYCYRYNQGSLSHTIEVEKFDAAEKLNSLLHELMHDIPDSGHYVDAEYICRIRYLLMGFLLSEKFTLERKFEIMEKLSQRYSIRNIDLSVIRKETSWKYVKPLEMLMKGCKVSLIAFAFFDHYVNKNTILFWRH